MMKNPGSGARGKSVAVASRKPGSSARGKSVAVASRKPRILVAACGCVAAVKFGHICNSFSDWAEVRAVVTPASLRFVDRVSISKDVYLHFDEHDWHTWKRVGDMVLHIELAKWADIMVIAPLSANTLAKIAGGLCDNLLTCIVRAWDYSKPLFVAPSMNNLMWRNPSTERHCMSIDELGISLIPPIAERSASGEHNTGAMAEPATIFKTVRVYYDMKILKKKPGEV